MLLEKITDQITLPDAPSIAGLTFRPFQSEADYHFVVDLGNAGNAADGVEDIFTLEWAKNHFAHLTGFDLYRDMLFAEIDGQPVATARVWSRLLDDGTRLYMSVGSVLPQWRRRGIGQALLPCFESYGREQGAEKMWTNCREYQDYTIRFLEKAGFHNYGLRFESLLDLNIFDEGPFAAAIMAVAQADAEVKGAGRDAVFAVERAVLRVAEAAGRS